MTFHLEKMELFKLVKQIQLVFEANHIEILILLIHLFVFLSLKQMEHQNQQMDLNFKIFFL
jgi:hypothetical protein